MTPSTDSDATGEPIDLDPVWRALSDPTRRAILDELRAGPKNTTALCDRFDHLGRHGVIKHIKSLEAAGLLRVEAAGRERLNHLNVVPLQQISERWLKPYEAFWASSLYRLAETATENQSSNEQMKRKSS